MAKFRVLRLGRRKPDARSGSESRTIAADELMRAIKRLVPRVLEDFRDNVQDAGTFNSEKGRLPVFVPSKDLRHWQERWLLKSDAIRRWAVHTLGGWEDDDDLKAKLDWKVPPLNTMAWREHAIENMADPLAPIGALPDWEDADYFLRRAKRHYEARKDALQLLGDRPPPQQTEPAHFEWLVRFHIQSQDFPTIAAAVHQPRNTVQEAVSNVASLLGLKLRARTRIGRRLRRR
jgi:hypothetical protein